MQSIHPATPFGRRPVSLGLIAGALATREGLEAARAPGSNAPAAVNKWTLFKTITAARVPLGLSDRALTLLNALLSFHPEVALSLPQAERAGEGDPACDLVVFPSNKALAARAHGMAEKTIRRHLAALVDAGLLARRDSPNGKRYARRAGDGAGFSDAYGFDLTPLVLRAGEFEALAEGERQKALAVRRLAERVTILRRDIAKSLALAEAERLDGPFGDLQARLLALMTPLRRIGADPAALETLTTALTALRQEVTQCLEASARVKKMTGNDGPNDRHESNSKAKDHSEPEPAFHKARGEVTDAGDERDIQTYPLGMVLDACPDVAIFAEGGSIGTWAAFHATVRTIRPMLGISPDAYGDARTALGEAACHIAIATILQRSEHSSEARGGSGSGLTVNGSPAIRSPGGYLRALVSEARAGTFHLGPVLMALIGQRLKARQITRSQSPGRS